MTDGVDNLKTGGAVEIFRPRGYQSEAVREVKARASVLERQNSGEEQRHVRRLNSLLTQDQPLRGDVPRGFYLNKASCRIPRTPKRWVGSLGG